MFILGETTPVELQGPTTGTPGRARPARQFVVWGGLVVFLGCGVFLSGCTELPPDIDSLGRANNEQLSRHGDALEQEEGKGVIRFGFDIRASPQEDAKQYLPFLRYLEQATDYAFKLQFTQEGSSLVDELGSGRVQVAAVGAGTLLKAQSKHRVMPLVRGVNLDDKAEYRSVIVTAPDSDIRELSDLRGKLFAFGSFTSTQGHLIPRILLFQNDVPLSQLAGHEYAGSHREAAEAVITGRVHAAGLQDTLGMELARAGLLRIIQTSDYYPSSGIAVGPGLDADVVSRIKQALLAFEPRNRHAEGLHDWQKTEMPHGFVEAEADDYEELEFWSRRFALLEPEATPG